MCISKKTQTVISKLFAESIFSIKEWKKMKNKAVIIVKEGGLCN